MAVGRWRRGPSQCTSRPLTMHRPCTLPQTQQEGLAAVLETISSRHGVEGGTLVSTKCSATPRDNVHGTRSCTSLKTDQRRLTPTPSQSRHADNVRGTRSCTSLKTDQRRLTPTQSQSRPRDNVHGTRSCTTLMKLQLRYMKQRHQHQHQQQQRPWTPSELLRVYPWPRQSNAARAVAVSVGSDSLPA